MSAMPACLKTVKASLTGRNSVLLNSNSFPSPLPLTPGNPLSEFAYLVPHMHGIIQIHFVPVLIHLA